MLLGVCGSIAAYKTAELARLLVQEDMQLRVMMTHSAADFVTAKTLSTLSNHEVFTDFYQPNGVWNSHVALGLWADYMLIAPLSAHTMAKMAKGMADSILLATYLSVRCPVVVAPAMDHDMYIHPATQANMDTLRSQGVHILPSVEGALASGLHGMGRMQEPEAIVGQLRALLTPQRFAGKRVLLTAGPTYEAIDPVRFIGNFSSGKMGAALARCLAEQGATVELVLGPCAVEVEQPNIRVHRVLSADEMYAAASALHPDVDIALFSAAVADYKPQTLQQQKIKKGKGVPEIRLTENPDIAQALGERKQPHQLHVGFALESHDAVSHAKQKLQSKHFDFIVLNSLQDEGAGFQHDTNKVTLLFHEGDPQAFPLASKDEVATYIVDALHRQITLTDRV